MVDKTRTKGSTSDHNRTSIKRVIEKISLLQYLLNATYDMFWQKGTDILNLTKKRESLREFCLQ